MKIYKEEKPVDIPLNSMKDGDIGALTMWRGSAVAINGTIVQRYGQSLIQLGKGSQWSWGCIFDNDVEAQGCRVRILEKGTLLEV